MSRPIAVEQVEQGDHAVLWFQGAAAPVTVLIDQIEEGSYARTLKCIYQGMPFDVTVPHGHTVDLAC